MRARAVLSEKQIENAKPAQSGKRYMLWDAVVPSLALRVTDHGHRSFVLQRRVNGRMVKLTLGEYPALALAKARDAARARLEEMVHGIDPRQSAPARVTSTGVRRDSFEGAVDSYIKREVEKNRRPRTQDEIVRPLRKLLVPKWGSLPLASIDAGKIVDVLDELVEANKRVAANRTLSVLRRFFRWCVERHLVDANPAAAIAKPTKEESRSRFLDDDELREIWNAMDALGWPFGPFVRGLILTGQRRTELSSSTWSEFELDEKRWTIPANRTKNGKEHVVPVSPAMRSILAAAPRYGREDEQPEEQQRRPVFTTTGKTPISGFSRAKTALDHQVVKIRRDAAEKAGRDPSKVKPLRPWTLHDLRRSCATGMERIGILPHVIEMVLNHSGGFRSGVAGVYQRHPYMNERRDALDRWGEHVVSLTTPSEPARNVIKMVRRSK